MSTQEAARAITKSVLSADNPDEHRDRLSNFLQNALAELSAANIHPLLDLLRAIQDLSDPGFTFKPTPWATQHQNFSWKGLPGFGGLWPIDHRPDNLYSYLRFALFSVTDSMDARQKARALFIRRANIEARLAVANLGGIPLDWGYNAIADALERDDSIFSIMDFEIPIARE